MPRLTPDQVTDYILSGRADGVGIFCGIASGGVMMIEVEGRALQLLPALRDHAVQVGAVDLLDRLTGCCDESPSGGRHWYVRVVGGDTPGNDRLACDASGEVLFETRGQGGWSVVAPSAGRTHQTGKPYRFVSGSPATIPNFTPEELTRLLDLFRAMDQRPAQVVPERVKSSPAVKRDKTDGNVWPADDFNDRATWDDVLTGWTRVQAAGDTTHWRRPGKKHGTSATTTGGVLCCFSSSAGLPIVRKGDKSTSLSKFATYAHLNHAGDFTAAAKALYALGYGTRMGDLEQDNDDDRPAPEARPLLPGRPRDLADWRAEVSSRLAAAVATPGVCLNTSPTGSGKTHATITALQRASSSLTVLPTHSNVSERVTEMQTHGIDAVAFPELTSDNCQQYDKASEAQRYGLIVGAAVCPGCEYNKAGTCQYRNDVAAAGKAAHRVATHERLRKSSGTAAGVQVVVVDENPENVVAPRLIVRRDWLKPVETLCLSIRNHWFSKANPEQKHFAGVLLATVHAIHAACDRATAAGVTSVDLSGMGADVPKNWQTMLFRSIGSVGVGRDFEAEAMTVVTMAATGQLTSLDVVTDCTPKGDLHHFVQARWDVVLSPETSVILLDATGDAGDVAAATGLDVTDITPEGHIPTVHPVVQVVDDCTKGSSSSSAAGQVEAFLDRHPEVQRLGVIGHQRHIRDLVDGGGLGPAARARVAKSCYFGQGPDRASNDWHDTCDHLLILGTPRANPGDYRRWLVAHGLPEAASLDDGDWGPRDWQTVTVDGNPVTVRASGYRNPDWHRAYQAVAWAALHQAVGRGRPILPEGIPVTIVSPEPTPYPVAPSLDVTPAALRDTVHIVQLLLADPRGATWELSPIRESYREKYPSGLVPTAAVVQVVENRGMTRRAATKRLNQCRDAGLLAQPHRGWWAIPGGVSEKIAQPSGIATPAAAEPVRVTTPKPAELVPIPGVIVAAHPPGPDALADDAVQVVAAAVTPAVTSVTCTTDDTPGALYDRQREDFEERAAIMEYDAGYDRAAAERLAAAEVYGSADPSVQLAAGDAVQDDAGVDHTVLSAAGHPLVSAAMKRLGARVVQVVPRPPEEPHAHTGRRPGHCRCGAKDWKPVRIHGGRSVRVDCGHCDRFGWFGVWHGQRQQPPAWAADDPEPRPAAPPRNRIQDLLGVTPVPTQLAAAGSCVAPVPPPCWS